MTERDALRLLSAIKDLALLGHPYPEGTELIDVGLILCLGLISGLASKALDERQSAYIEAMRRDPDLD